MAQVLSVEDPEVWVQPASFILVGCLVFSSVRGFLKQFIKVWRPPSPPPRLPVQCRVLVCSHCLSAFSFLRSRWRACLLQLFTAWSSSVSSNSVVLLLAQVMGMYVPQPGHHRHRRSHSSNSALRACGVLTRNLPPPYRYFTSYVLLMRMNLPPKYRCVATVPPTPHLCAPVCDPLPLPLRTHTLSPQHGDH